MGEVLTVLNRRQPPAPDTAVSATETIYAEYRADRRFLSLVSVGIIALIMAIAFFIPALVGSQGWWVTRDVWITFNSAEWIRFGGFGSMYSANLYTSALPGFPLLLAPVALIAAHLPLTNGYPFYLPEPTLFYLVGPIYALASVTLLFGMDYLLVVLRVTSKARRWIAVVTGVLVITPTPMIEGHPEDLLALALVCVSVAMMIQGRFRNAAISLTLTILMQTWAGLLIPILFVMAPAGRRIVLVIQAAIIPAVVGIYMLASDWTHASLQLLKQPMYNTGQHLPWFSIAPRLHFPKSYGLVVSGSHSRSYAIVLVLAAAFALWRKRDVGTLLWASGIAMLARDLFEVTLYPYYLVPAGMLLLAALWYNNLTKRDRVLGIVALLLLYGGSSPPYFGVHCNIWVFTGLMVLDSALILWLSAPGWLVASHRQEHLDLAVDPAVAS